MRIGFVDHHLNNFHANKFKALLHGPLADLGARVALAWESDPAGEDWCAAQGVERCSSPEEVAARADAVLVLAPDNVETHVDLCRRVFPAGKPVFVDKFLAPTAAEADTILALAKGTPLFSASALRFAVEVEAVLPGLGPVEEAFARGVGEWDGYGVHTLSLVVAALGADIEALADTGAGTTAAVTLRYRDGRRGYLDVRAADNQWDSLAWSFGYRVGGDYHTGVIADSDGFYASLMRRVVAFFQTGDSPVEPQEMRAIPAVLEAAARSRDADGRWIAV
jgi:hypothetical protein